MEFTKMDVMQVLKNDGGRVTVSSLDVARFFEKQHDNVLKSIRNLIELKPELGLVTYNESSYTNSQNKVQPCYLMDRDGFNLLAMGFTGAKALDFKIAFIDAFNEMERQLKMKDTPPALPSKEKGILEAFAYLGELAGAPKHIVLTEAVKEVRRVTGTDLSGALISGSVMDNIKDDEMMLEPTELGEMFKQQLSGLGFTHGNAGVNTNRFLASKGFQSKQGTLWVASKNLTDGKQYMKHAVPLSCGKSTYNLKWNIQFVKSLFKQ